MQALGTLGGKNGAAYGINERGEIVGSSTLPGDQVLHPALWAHGAVLDLGTLGNGNAFATAINDKGQIVGQYNQNNTYRPFLYENGAMSDLGTLGGIFGKAEAINDKGEIIGYSDPGDSTAHAFLYIAGKMTDLGTFGFTGSDAHALNDRGHIVGTVRQSSGDTLAALFFRGQGILLLNGLLPSNSGWNLTDARGINNHGVVVGSGSRNGEQRAYALTLPNSFGFSEDKE